MTTERNDERTPNNSRWTVNPFGRIRNSKGRVVYDPVPPPNRKRRDKVWRAMTMKDPQKRRAALIRLGILPEESI